MSDNSITIFAATNFRNSRQKFGIKQDDRRRHMYLIGKTGMGKSVLQENMIIHDIQSGHGVAVVDPHGDLVEKVIKYIPSNRINDVIYFNPSDTAHPIAFNVVERVEPEYRHLVASGLIGIFQKLWADSWGPRLEYILRNAILAILDYPGSTLMAVTRMLSDKPFRKKVIEKIQDPVVKAFWVNEFAGYADKFASEAVSPIQNKVGQFLSSSLIRNIVGQVQSSLNIRQIMDDRKILLMNLSKGHIGEDNSALLGAMMITKIQLAAMSRVDTPEDKRVDFYLYVDEFQNFATSSFANILSEARKYRLNLIMAHQYIAQLTISENMSVWPAVQGNVGTLVVFRVGAADAEELVKEFDPQYIESDLVNLPKYNFYIKLMIDGVASHPFSAIGLPPKTAAEETHNVEKVIAVSRERYSGSREVVEEKIMRWHGMGDDAEKEPEPERDFKKKNNFPGQKSFSEQKFAPKNNFSRPEPTRANSGGQSFVQRNDGRQVQNQRADSHQFPAQRDERRFEQKNFHDRPKKVVQPQSHIAKRYYDTNDVQNDVEPVKKSSEIINQNIGENNAELETEDVGISLAAAISQGTVDFKGKKIEKKDEAAKDSNNQIEVKQMFDKNQNLDQNKVQNGRIKMGEKIRINNNKKY